MKFNKIILIASLVVVTTMSTLGCSNSSSNKAKKNESVKTEATSTKKKVEGSIIKDSNTLIDEDVKKYYDDYLIKLKENMEKNIKERPEVKEVAEKNFKKIEKNLPTFIELNQKAKESCAKGFYVEGTIKSSMENNGEHKLNIKSSNGNSRKEEHIDGKLAFLSIYSKDKDTAIDYDANKDKVKKVTKFSKKHRGEYPYQYGYFIHQGTNAPSADLKYIDYKGKKVVYGENIFESIDNGGNKFKIISKYWYDAKTGIIIKEQQESYNGDGSKSTYSTEYTIKFNQKFDKDTFTFDKSKLKK